MVGASRKPLYTGPRGRQIRDKRKEGLHLRNNSYKQENKTNKNKPTNQTKNKTKQKQNKTKQKTKQNNQPNTHTNKTHTTTITITTTITTTSITTITTTTNNNDTENLSTGRDGNPLFHRMPSYGEQGTNIGGL